MTLNQNMILQLWRINNMVVVMQPALFEDEASYGDVKNDIKGGEQNDPE